MSGHRKSGADKPRPVISRTAAAAGGPGAQTRAERRANRRAAARTRSGFGRVLVAIYAILALSATARGVTQLFTRGSEAPVAYSFSVGAGVIYLVATIALGFGGRFRPLAWAACAVEAIGVLAVGTLVQFDAAAFPDQTVWSGWGAGYGYVPLVLPFVGLWWLWHTRSRRVAAVPESEQRGRKPGPDSQEK